MARSAVEVVELYILEVWNKGRVELMDEICADEIVRHDANTRTVVARRDQVSRIRSNYDELRTLFVPIVLSGNDEFVTLVWDVSGRDPNFKLCGIEVFRIVDGRIVEVWNSPYVDGQWGEPGMLALALDEGTAAAVPLMSAKLTDTGAALLVPLEQQSIGRWLAAIMGQPRSTQGSDGRWHHAFAGGDGQGAVQIGYSRPGQDDRHLGGGVIDRLEIAWQRSGLINVEIDISASSTARPASSEVAPAPATISRFTEVYGSMSASEGRSGEVAAASITLGAARNDAGGVVTLRLHGCGTGAPATIHADTLVFGWKNDAGYSIEFLVEDAELADAKDSFTDDHGVLQATYRWSAPKAAALLINDAAWQG